MNIVLLTPTPPDINAFGVRMISAVLRKAGYSTKIVFLPGGVYHLRPDGSSVYQYSEKTLQQIGEICSDADLIGVSFMSNYLDRAIQISEYIRKHIYTALIWGGIHPTCRPEESMKWCDGVCIGEGDVAVLELAGKILKKEDYTDIKNFWFNVNGTIKKNPTGELVQNLDDLPYVDYELRDHYVFDWKSSDIIPVDEAVLKDQFLRTPYFKNKNLITYRTMTSRGCPHRCSYCASSSMLKLRRRSVDNVIDELEKMLNKFNYIEIISFFDDTFFAAPIHYFEEFRDKYKKKIGLPFHAQCSPSTITKHKMDLLVDAGLYHTEMGIQTGSERIKHMYKRVESNDKIISATELIAEYNSKMMPSWYHIILDNPWETVEDVKDTMKLVLRIPGKFKFSISSLMLYPGTELNERAKKEGILKDEINEVCRKPFNLPKGNYLNYLIYLAGFSAVPRSLLRFLSKDLFVNLLHRQEDSRTFKFLFYITARIHIAAKGLRALATGDFARIANYFKLAR